MKCTIAAKYEGGGINVAIAVSNDAEAQSNLSGVRGFGAFCDELAGISILASFMAYGVARLFTVIDPVVAAVFGATLGLVAPVINIATDRVLGDPRFVVAEVIKFAIEFFASTAISLSIASALGCAITARSALTLAVITVVTLPFFSPFVLCVGVYGVAVAVGSYALSWLAV